MAAIDTYANDTTINDDDRLIGSDSANSNVTRNFRLEDISDYVRNNVVIGDITDVTATELNILDGATITTAELNILDGVTSTAAELNLLDGLTATTDELNFVDGVTSSIQDQINGKQSTVTGAATTVTGADLTASRALLSNSDGKIAVSDVTSTELGYLDGVTSSIQTQINNIVEFEPANTGNANQILQRTSGGYQWVDASAASYTLTAATSSTLGGVIVEDSSAINIDSDGKLTLGNHSASLLTAGVIGRQRLSTDTPTDGQVLTWDNTNSLMVWSDKGGGGGGGGDFDAAGDYTISGDWIFSGGELQIAADEPAAKNNGDIWLEGTNIIVYTGGEEKSLSDIGSGGGGGNQFSNQQALEDFITNKADFRSDIGALNLDDDVTITGDWVHSGAFRVTSSEPATKVNGDFWIDSNDFYIRSAGNDINLSEVSFDSSSDQTISGDWIFSGEVQLDGDEPSVKAAGDVWVDADDNVMVYSGSEAMNISDILGESKDHTITGDWTFRDTLDVEHTNTNALLSLISNRSAPVPGLGGFLQFFANNDANAQVRAGTITGTLTSITDDDEAGRFQFWLRDPDNASNSTSDTATALQMTITHDGVELEQPLTLNTVADGVTTDKILSVTSAGLVQQVDYPSGGSGDVTSSGGGIEGTPTNNQVVAWDNTNSRLYWKDDDTGSGTFSTSTDYTITGDWTFNENFTIGATDNRDGVVTIWPDVIFRGGQFNEDFAAYGNNILGSSNNADSNSIRGTNTFTGSLQIPDDAAATQVDGQIWYDTTNDKIMGRIDGADVDLGSQGTDNTLNAAVTDVLSLSGQEIGAVDAGTADAVVGWDDSASKLTYLTAADARAAIGAINAADNVDATGSWTFAENLTVGATDNRDGTVTFWPDVIFRGGQFNEDFATYGNSTFGSSDNSDTNKFRGSNSFTGSLVVPTAVASTQANGQIWYDTTDHVMYGRVNGANVSLSSVTAGNTVNANISDVVSLTGEEINGVDAGDADALVGWDDSASKLTYLSAADARAAINAVSSADAVTITKNWQFDENITVGATDNRDATVTFWPDASFRGVTVNDDLAVYGDTTLGSSDNSDSASIRGTITTTGSLAIPTAAPGTLVNGQIWHLTNEFFTRINGSTVGLVGDNGMGINGTPTNNQVVAWDNTNSRLYWKDDAAGSGTFDASSNQTITGTWAFNAALTANGDFANYGNTTLGSSDNSDDVSIRGDVTTTGTVRLPLAAPTTPTDGQIWYNDTSDQLEARINGATVNIGAGGSVDATADYNWTGKNTWTVDSVDEDWTFTNSAGLAEIDLVSSAAAADNAIIGNIGFFGNNDNATPEITEYANISVTATDVSDGTEDAQMSIKLIDNGALRELIRIDDNDINIFDNINVENATARIALYDTSTPSFNGVTIGAIRFDGNDSNGDKVMDLSGITAVVNDRTPNDTKGQLNLSVATSGTPSSTTVVDALRIRPDSIEVNTATPLRIGGDNAANELDDYEEGTWTPVASQLTAAAGTNNSANSYANGTTGHYTKIGENVFCKCYLQIPTNSDSSTIYVRNDSLPFSMIEATLGGSIDGHANSHTATRPNLVTDTADYVRQKLSFAFGIDDTYSSHSGWAVWLTFSYRTTE